MTTASPHIAICEFDFDEFDLEKRMCEPRGFQVSCHPGREPQQIIQNAKGAAGIITSYGVFTRQVFEALSPTLKVVSRTGVGYDTIDIQAAAEFGVTVCNVPGYANEVVSDHAIALALTCLRRINEQDANLRAGIWPYASTRPLGQCAGRTFGVFGMGDIGKAAARKAAGLGFDVVCWSRSLTPGTVTPEGYRVLDLDEVFSTADVISLHCALCADTHHLVDARAISLMKPGAVVVNTARGAVVDTLALAAALVQGRIWGAGLDVFETEPLQSDHPILSAPHTVLTPHAAYWSEESGIELRTRACQAVIDVLEGRQPQNPLN